MNCGGRNTYAIFSYYSTYYYYYYYYFVHIQMFAAEHSALIVSRLPSKKPVGKE
jgi:hypothetical protein